MKRIILFIAMVLFTFGTTHAERYVGSSGQDTAPSTNNTGKTGAFDCSPSTSQIDLDINNIRARLLAGGDFWWDGVETAQYEVPKIDPSSGATPLSTLFTGALWFTGLDDGGNLQCAAQTFRGAGRHDFYTGPLSGNLGEVSFDVCTAYDEHFEVFADEIDEVRTLFLANGGTPIPSSQIPTNVLRWPGKGNPYYLNAETDKYFIEGSLAPFFDVDGNDIYDPTKGDFPVIGASTNGVITQNYADQMIFWVINDNGQVHGRSGGVPIGVQVNCLAFAYSTADDLNNMTFYTFEVIKKTPDPIFDTYMGVFVDPDLGTPTDDFIGCDTIREMGFVYNASAVDQQYGTDPPLVAIDFFEGPIGDDGNQLGLSSFVYFNNAQSGPQTDPDDAPEFRNYQTGKWKDGSDVIFGGTGYGAGTATNYVYPGNPSDAAGWSECTAGSNPDDRRFVQNSGPFTLNPGEPQRISIGVITIFPSNYNGCFDIDAIFGVADDLAQNLFDNDFDIIDGPDAPTLAIRELSNEIVINLVNEEGSNNFGENYVVKHALPNNGVVGNDSLYRFQGYMVYQLKDIKVTAQDLNDETKAKLIFQSDLNDDISSIYNYTNNNVSGYNANLQVEGANTGISRTFVVTEDQFADGDRALVNNRKYYFAAIAYATSDYEAFPAVSSLPDLEIFKQGRGNFNTYSAIPHDTDTRNGGTVLQAETGDPLAVTRLEGEGNGGVAIRLTEATVEAILSSSTSFEDILEYELGYDPIVARVMDPLKLQNVDFELRFEAYTQFPDTLQRIDTFEVSTNTPPFTRDSLDTVDIFTFRYEPEVFFSDSNYWKMLVRNDIGTIIDTIKADRDFNREYQQLVPEYGISISVNIPTRAQVNLDNNQAVYSPIESSIDFEDPTKDWLSFITDEGFATPTNWIRSGSNLSTEPTNIGVFDDHQYDAGPNTTMFYDPFNALEETIFGTSLLGGNIAPYCLTANYANPDVGIVEGRSEFSYGPAFRWDVWDVLGNTTIVNNPVNTLEELRSVSIVITPDNTNNAWTNAAIFETSDELTKGAIIGTGQFPGYAINLETGERLNIAFGEASDLSGYNGGDGRWNPTSEIEDVITSIPGLDAIYKEPIWGGKHFVYVFNSRYDESFASSLETLYQANPINTAPNVTIPTDLADVYSDIMYTFIPIVKEGYEFLNPSDIATKTTITLNINRPFLPLTTSETLGAESNNSLPRYKFSTLGLAPLENQEEVAKNGLEDVRVVPNPYYAYSAYEESQIDNVVKIIGLPDRCEVSIFSLDGKLVRKFDRAVGSSSNTNSNRQEIADGQAIGSGINLDNSISWNLQNSQRIPVGSGTYIIHINSFDLGETVVKAAIFMRPTDVSNF